MHIEKKLTLEELKTSNPELADIHSEEFNQALSRGIYYHACYLVGMDDVDGAKKLMANLTNRYNLFFTEYAFEYICEVMENYTQERN